MMPATMSARLMSREVLAGSPSSTIPRITVPTAPTPTQTLYAVPTGRDFMASPSSQRLMIMASAVHTVGHNREKPSVYFKPMAHPTSNNPAAQRTTHAMLFSPAGQYRLVVDPLLGESRVAVPLARHL